MMRIVEFEFRNECVNALGESLDSGPIHKLKEETDGIHEEVFLQKQLVSRFGAFAVHIYADEHAPPHFHVEYNGDSNSFSIETGEPLHPNNGLSRYFRNVKKWYRKSRPILIDAWNNTRPSDCVVGPICAD